MPIKPLDEQHTLKFVEGYTAAEKIRDLDVEGYAIHQGRYSERHASHAKKFGPFIVTVYKGEVVGVARMAFFWMHPDHRGSSIASEMHYSFVLSRGGPHAVTVDGVKAAVTSEYATKHQHRVTPAGLKMLQRTYELFVERGIIIEV
jgi:hypothetical protein